MFPIISCPGSCSCSSRAAFEGRFPALTHSHSHTYENAVTFPVCLSHSEITKGRRSSPAASDSRLRRPSEREPPAPDCLPA